MESNKNVQISSNPKMLLHAMQEHELLISRLYSVFAEKYPEHETVWKKLSEDEIHHAKWIEKIQVIINTSSSGVIVERFPMAALETSSAFVKKLIEQFSHVQLPLIQALSHAIYLEKALIENKFFEIFQSEDATIQQTLKMLKEETERHFNLVQKLFLEDKK